MYGDFMEHTLNRIKGQQVVYISKVPPAIWLTSKMTIEVMGNSELKNSLEDSLVRSHISEVVL